MLTPRSAFPSDDLRTAVRWALEREGPLFAAGERVVLARILALPDDAAELYARLSLRAGEVFRVAGLSYACATPEALAALEAAGLVGGQLPDARVLPAFTADQLREACRRLGLRTGGSRGELEARLQGRAWRAPGDAVVGVRHRELLRRVERLGGFDRALAPVERIAGTRWADYTPTRGPGAFPTRAALRAWERARRGEFAPGEALAIARAGPPPWGRSPFRHAVEALLLAGAGADELAGIAGLGLEHVRALEAEGRLDEALERCRRSDPDAELALALARTGKRLARQLRRPWAPTEPLRSPAVRRFWLRRAGVAADGRPAWQGDGDPDPAPIEQAMVRRVQAAGREALHAENWLWTSLFALVFRELYWLPLPGRLPTARRSGPTDLGTPAFHLARQEPAERILARLRAEGVAPFAAAWTGERLDGLVRPEQTLAVAGRLEGGLVAAVLSRILRLGWAAARGLPDLLVLPGAGSRLDGAIPSTIPERAFFAEIKGPTDSVRDGQRLWHDSLVMSGETVEIWELSEQKRM